MIPQLLIWQNLRRNQGIFVMVCEASRRGIDKFPKKLKNLHKIKAWDSSTTKCYSIGSEFSFRRVVVLFCDPIKCGADKLVCKLCTVFCILKWLEVVTSLHICFGLPALSSIINFSPENACWQHFYMKNHRLCGWFDQQKGMRDASLELYGRRPFFYSYHHHHHRINQIGMSIKYVSS